MTIQFICEAIFFSNFSYFSGTNLGLLEYSHFFEDQRINTKEFFFFCVNPKVFFCVNPKVSWGMGV